MIAKDHGTQSSIYKVYYFNISTVYHALTLWHLMHLGTWCTIQEPYITCPFAWVELPKSQSGDNREYISVYHKLNCSTKIIGYILKNIFYQHLKYFSKLWVCQIYLAHFHSWLLSYFTNKCLKNQEEGSFNWKEVYKYVLKINFAA